MSLSMVWIIIDLLSVTPVISIGVINPFWKFAFVFKCFTDSIILDDFKSALDKLSRHRRAQILPFDLFPDSSSGQNPGISEADAYHHRKPKGLAQKKQDFEQFDMGLSDVGGPCVPSSVVVQHME